MIWSYFSNRPKNEDYDTLVKSLKTGDIILYQTTGHWYSRAIEYFTGSKYSHISIILKNPTWLDPSLTEDVYILESGAEDFPGADTGKITYGVQIASFRKVWNEYFLGDSKGSLYIRRINTNIPDLQDRILESYKSVKGKPYDLHPRDWLDAFIDESKPLDQIGGNEQRTDCFWCSALVSYIFIGCKFLDKNVPWTIITPQDYSYDSQRLIFKDCSFDIDTQIL